MTTALLYIFVFTTWGLGLLSWLVGIGHFVSKSQLEAEDKSLDIEQKKFFISKINSLPNNPGAKPPSFAVSSPKELPDKIKELMKSSPTHPEVEEIDSDDEIIGVRFEAENYPPGFGDSDDD